MIRTRSTLQAATRASFHGCRLLVHLGLLQSWGFVRSRSSLGIGIGEKGRDYTSRTDRRAGRQVETDDGEGGESGEDGSRLHIGEEAFGPVRVRQPIDRKNGSEG